MKQSELISYLDSYLQIGLFSPSDYSLNGLVVGSPEDRKVEKVAVAVDASLSTFERAIEAGCTFLIVHHGLFWGAPIAITGPHYRRIKTLLESNLALYAAHLPLDAHPEVGNNAQMAKRLGLEEIEPFVLFKGVNIGFKGRFSTPRSAQWVCDQLGFDDPVILSLGKEKCTTVGIVSGGASDELGVAIAEDLDLYITGEIKHEAYHQAAEEPTTVIGGGHYNTEVYGVKALGEHLSERFGLEVLFIEDPTGL